MRFAAVLMLLTPAAVPARAQMPAADTAAALHLLNRLTFGPRPGDIAAVQRAGVAAWLDAQLSPASIPDPIQDEIRRRWDVAFLPPERQWTLYPPAQVQQRDRMDSARAMNEPRGRRGLGAQVQMATFERMVGSERQLLEVMTDFWFNHFNVFMGKQAVRWLASDYVERAIRPHALGRFDELLLAVAQHPAMLVYLDNARSIAPGATPPAAGRRRQRRMSDQEQQRMPQGLNENYARELLELHTLGVDAGYSQSDVQSVARILTGWSVDGAQRGQFTFTFREWAHDRGEKIVLGSRFPAGRGMDEGVALLRMLAAHPATARHLAHKLCRRFVNDEPPDGCVDDAVLAFRRSGGDIRETLRAIVESPDFWAEPNRRAKVKSPQEFLASALRATLARPDTTPRAMATLQQLGQPLFLQPVPTGWPETQADWVNSGALLARMNIAVAIASGRFAGIRSSLDSLIPDGLDGAALLDRINAVVLAGLASENTLRVIREQALTLPDARARRSMALGLALGSPEFQRQ